MSPCQRAMNVMAMLLHVGVNMVIVLIIRLVGKRLFDSYLMIWVEM